jgi:hypothetical protein
MEEYENYLVIIKGEHCCIGFNPEASMQFVCWRYTYDKGGVHSGIYVNDFKYALNNFRERESAYL